MFDTASPALTSTQEVAAVVAALGRLDRMVSDQERIEQIRVLEELKAAAAAAQARAAADLDASVRQQHADLGLPAREHGRGVAAQVALARRESPVSGGRHLGLAKALVHEMPHTHAALTTGRLSEWRATLLVRETACLSREHRATVDERLAGDPARLEGLGDRALAAEARKLAYRLDPNAALARARKAESERAVTVRPAPDTMSYLTGLLPVAQGVAAYAALVRAADAARAAGDPRSRGQVMADTLVERVTGQTAAAAVPIEVEVVITDRALLDPGGPDGQEPAWLPGYGPVPGGWVRDVIGSSAAEDARVSMRRLFTHPRTNELVALDARSRTFPEGLRRFLRLRDRSCRTSWCDAPVRHADHVVPSAAGGDTSAANGQGLCEQCNYAKQAPGWRSVVAAARPHEVVTTTPTGHAYRSRAPGQPGAPPPRTSRLELSFRDLVVEAA
ncbi:MAG TPA: DUF222 domain-containing protein [Nocardioides sp.]|uniref:HNH endonuclease n=1 Tax=Nocardioides sp. TaxID=35761 RepID=UPI002D7F123B|nr:DUF222 domain-containing protein [Nocardioides sp.]HET6652154.1 DUF222 domain-containing protein [Nocardioides sp.]